MQEEATTLMHLPTFPRRPWFAKFLSRRIPVLAKAANEKLHLACHDSQRITQQEIERGGRKLAGRAPAECNYTVRSGSCHCFECERKRWNMFRNVCRDNKLDMDDDDDDDDDDDPEHPQFELLKALPPQKKEPCKIIAKSCNFDLYLFYRTCCKDLDRNTRGNNKGFAWKNLCWIMKASKRSC